MKSTDERVNEVLSRARVREVSSRRRRQRAVAFGGGALAVAVVAAVGVGASSLAGDAAPSAGATLGLMGSVFAGGSALSYVVVGLLGLALGVAVTVLAYRFGRAQNKTAFRGEDEISVLTLPDRENRTAKGQFAKSSPESSDTNSPNCTDSSSSEMKPVHYDEGPEP